MREKKKKAVPVISTILINSDYPNQGRKGRRGNEGTNTKLKVAEKK